VRSLVLSGAVLLAALPSGVRAQSPAGTEFQVNTYTTSYQGRPSVASDRNGNFVVVWQSYAQDGSYYGVFGQRFNASGVVQGSEFQVSTYTTGTQGRAAVASDANGNFVVVWQSYPGQDGSFSGVFGQRFNAYGTPQSSQFRVNSYTTDYQGRAAVASDANGNFVVVWMSSGQDGDASGVFGQRFDASGVPQGSEFQVNSYTTSNQFIPAVASDANGNFVIVWMSYGPDGYESGVFGQRFDAAGIPQGNEFPVNSFTTGRQRVPRVASDAIGNFVVVWESGPKDGSSYGVFGQRFDAAGAPQGSEFQINSYTTYSQERPTVASDADGNFTVIWRSYLQDGSSFGVFGQRFNAAGVPQAGEFRVNSYTTGYQAGFAVASDADGDFVVVWGSVGQRDGSGSAVLGQRYGDIIFKDGFDSGGLGRWSSSFTDDGDLSASGAGAMAATAFGLEAVVNDLNGIFVQDDSPNGESRYRARFYFNSNGFDPGEGDSHFRTRIFIAFDASNQRVITLVLKRQSGAYSVEGRVRLNDGTRVDTGFFGITDGPHMVELDWRRSSAPAADNGMFSLWIDDGLMASLSGLDNDLSPVEFVRMGALGLKTGAAGTLYYDQFESRRLNFMGPE